MIIRKGTPKDLPAILDLIRELAHFEREPDAVEITLDELQRDGFGPNPLFYTFVAEINGEILGMALFYYRYSTWKGRTLHLEDLIVTQKARGTGIGKALYSKIIEQGKNDNLRRIEWNVLSWNHPAIAFYEKSGAKIMADWQVVQMDAAGIETYIDTL